MSFLNKKNSGYFSECFRFHANGTQFRSLPSHCETCTVVRCWPQNETVHHHRSCGHLVDIYRIGLIPAAIFSRLVDVKRPTFSNSSTDVEIDDASDVHSDSNQTKNETFVTLFRFCYPFSGKFEIISVHSQSVILGRFLIQYLIQLVIIGTFYTITDRNLLRRYS